MYFPVIPKAGQQNGMLDSVPSSLQRYVYMYVIAWALIWMLNWARMETERQVWALVRQQHVCAAEIIDERQAMERWEEGKAWALTASADARNRG
jgi:hypothetical protein